MPSSTEYTLAAAFLTKPIRSSAPIVRKEPLAFIRRGKRPDCFASLPYEPEDARLTGDTRSLYRRLLALNLSPARKMPSAAMPVSIAQEIDMEIKIA